VISDARRVLVVHGLFMTGAETVLLRRRLRAQGFEPIVFRYSSRHASLDSLLAVLARGIADLGEPFHAVGHSLGGVLLLRLLERYPALPLRRCVLLGAPARGSAAARRLAQSRLGARILGPLAIAELARERPAVSPAAAQLGVIAGTRSVGLGRLVTDLPRPNDGAVAVAETVVEGAADRIELPVSHTGMLLSPAVAREAARFLLQGRFGHPGDHG